MKCVCSPTASSQTEVGEGRNQRPLGTRNTGSPTISNTSHDLETASVTIDTSATRAAARWVANNQQDETSEARPGLTVVKGLHLHQSADGRTRDGVEHDGGRPHLRSFSHPHSLKYWYDQPITTLSHLAGLFLCL